VPGDVHSHKQSMAAADSEVSRSIYAQSVISGPASPALDFVRRFAQAVTAREDVFTEGAQRLGELGAPQRRIATKTTRLGEVAAASSKPSSVLARQPMSLARAGSWQRNAPIFDVVPSNNLPASLQQNPGGRA
jgi:hypothetical protein